MTADQRTTPRAGHDPVHTRMSAEAAGASTRPGLAAPAGPSPASLRAAGWSAAPSLSVHREAASARHRQCRAVAAAGPGGLRWPVSCESERHTQPCCRSSPAAATDPVAEVGAGSALLIILNGSSGWQVIPFLASDTAQVLWLVNLSLACRPHRAWRPHAHRALIPRRPFGVGQDTRADTSRRTGASTRLRRPQIRPLGGPRGRQAAVTSTGRLRVYCPQRRRQRCSSPMGDSSKTGWR